MIIIIAKILMIILLAFILLIVLLPMANYKNKKYKQKMLDYEIQSMKKENKNKKDK